MLTGHLGKCVLGPATHTDPCSLLNRGRARLSGDSGHRKRRSAQGDAHAFLVLLYGTTSSSEGERMALFRLDPELYPELYESKGRSGYLRGVGPQGQEGGFWLLEVVCPQQQLL